MIRRPPRSTLFPYTTLFRSDRLTFAVFPVAGYSLTSDTRDLASLRDLANNVIRPRLARLAGVATISRSEEHTSELQSQSNLVCRLLLEKKKKTDAECTDHVT